MNVGSKVVFSDADRPESGYLYWYHGDMFIIVDEHHNEVDEFNICRSEGTTYGMALATAERHFRKVEVLDVD